MILGHFTGNDFASTAMVLGAAFAVLGARRVFQGGERGLGSRGVRMALLGLALLAAGLASGLT